MAAIAVDGDVVEGVYLCALGRVSYEVHLVLPLSLVYKVGQLSQED